MGCCIALAAVVAVVRRAWYAVVRRSPAPVATFAPPARRPAPGATGATGAATAVAVGVPLGRASAPPPPLAAVLVAVGLAWFAVGVAGMHLLGWFAWAEGSLVSDTAFHASGLWLAALGGVAMVVRS